MHAGEEKKILHFQIILHKYVILKNILFIILHLQYKHHDNVHCKNTGVKSNTEGVVRLVYRLGLYFFMLSFTGPNVGRVDS